MDARKCSFGAFASVSWSNIHGRHWEIHGWGVSGHDGKMKFNKNNLGDKYNLVVASNV